MFGKLGTELCHWCITEHQEYKEVLKKLWSDIFQCSTKVSYWHTIDEIDSDHFETDNFKITRDWIELNNLLFIKDYKSYNNMSNKGRKKHIYLYTKYGRVMYHICSCINIWIIAVIIHSNIVDQKDSYKL